MFQGTGLEFLIFCGVCTTLLLLVCVISMCNRPRELLIIPPVQSPAAIEARIENAQDMVSSLIVLLSERHASKMCFTHVEHCSTCVPSVNDFFSLSGNC